MRQDTDTDIHVSTTVDNLTTVSEPRAEFDARVQSLYAQIVNAAGDDGIDRIDAVMAVTKKAHALIKSGKLRLPIDVTARLVNDSTRTVDNREGHKTLDRISEAASVLAGNSLLSDEDPLLSAVARIGAGRRKSWRYVNADDITHMLVMKTRHAQAAATAAAEFTEKAASVLKALRDQGRDATIGDVL